jgi:hypothetical protein
MKLRNALLIILLLSAVVVGQRRTDRAVEDEASGFVTNEDQGKAFIVTANTQSPVTLALRHKHNWPQQYSVFLGDGWSSDELRQQEPLLSNLLQNMPDANRLEDLGMKNVFASNPYQEKLIDLGTRRVSDLTIQAILTGMFDDYSLSRPKDPTVYVIYLDPSVESTLSGFNAGKHYLAYFNNFNISGLKVRYVVVPMSASRKQAYATALTAFISSVYN